MDGEIHTWPKCRYMSVECSDINEASIASIATPPQVLGNITKEGAERLQEQRSGRTDDNSGYDKTTALMNIAALVVYIGPTQAQASQRSSMDGERIHGELFLPEEL